MSKVFVTQESVGRNFVPAQKYGELVSLFPATAQVVISSQPTVRKLRRLLKDYCDSDYLLLSGDPIIMGLSMMVASEHNLGRLQLLKWDKQEKDYYPVKVDFFEKGGDSYEY
jgi:hypothetical protein